MRTGDRTTVRWRWKIPAFTANATGWWPGWAVRTAAAFHRAVRRARTRRQLANYAVYLPLARCAPGAVCRSGRLLLRVKARFVLLRLFVGRPAGMSSTGGRINTLTHQRQAWHPSANASMPVGWCCHVANSACRARLPAGNNASGCCRSSFTVPVTPPVRVWRARRRNGSVYAASAEPRALMFTRVSCPPTL